MKAKRGENADVKEDIGFGVQGRNGYQRLVTRDGRFNVERRGARFLHVYDLYVVLIRMPWWKFNLLVATFYLTANLVFALFYWWVGVDYLTGIDKSSAYMSFMDTFFFSAQTLTTVGYGRIAPIGVMESTVAAVESLMGVMSFALVTGLLYGRFSRPVANLLYSSNMLVTPHNGERAMMFRVANKSHNQLIDVEVSLIATYQEFDVNGKAVVHYKPLELELRKIQYLPLNWTLVHVMNEKSPLYGWSSDDFENQSVEILVTFKGTDDTFMQDVHDRTSYRYKDFVWGARFLPMFEPSPDGRTVLHLDLLDAYKSEALPELTS